MSETGKDRPYILNQLRDHKSRIETLESYYHIERTESGWVNTNDWTNRHFGSVEIPYDNLSGTFQVGETISEAISGNSGIIMYDDGSNLYINKVTQGGVFTDNRQITGSTSGATADVNTPGTTTKNRDSVLYHNFNNNLREYIIKTYASTDGTDATSFNIPISTDYTGSVSYNITTYQNDINSVKVQTGEYGCLYLSDAFGVSQALNTQDYYYNIVAYNITLI